MYGPLIKAGAIALAFLLLLAVAFYRGMQWTQQQWDAAIAKQALRAADTVVAQAENTAKVEVQYIKIKGDTEIVTHIVEKKVIEYVESPTAKCALSPEFERTFDAISRLYNPGADRVSAASDPPGDSHEPTGSDVTDVEVLHAYQQAVAQMKELWIAYDALVKWIRTNYVIDQAGAGRHAMQE